MSTMTLGAFFVTVLLNELIPGPVMMLVLTRTACAGRWAGIWTVLGIALAQLLTLGLAFLAIAGLVQLSGEMRTVLEAGGLVMLLWLAWRGWNTPRTDADALSGQAAPAVTYDLARGMIVSVASPYNLFLMFGLLPSLVAPHALRADHIVLLTTAFLLATVAPHVATIWAGSALHHIWSQQSRLFARAGALLMLGFAGVGLLGHV